MSGEHVILLDTHSDYEQESGDNLPLVYAALAENRRILMAHKREQDAIEAGVCVCGETSCRNCPEHSEPEEPDLEYACPPQWVRDPPSLPCCHGRASWQMCPHCLGLSAGLMPLDEGARAIEETDRILEQYGEAFRELAK